MDKLQLMQAALKSEPVNACHCVGPQNGQPRCPCAMRGVQIINGRYVLPAQDLGPAPATSIPSQGVQP